MYFINDSIVEMVFGYNGILRDTSEKRIETYRGNMITGADKKREYYLTDSLFWISYDYEKRVYNSENGLFKIVEFFSIDSLSSDTLSRAYWFDKDGECVKKIEKQQFQGYSSFLEIKWSKEVSNNVKSISTEIDKRRARIPADKIRYKDNIEAQNIVTVDYSSIDFSQIALLNGTGLNLFDLGRFPEEFILLDFWYLSCAPCLTAMPELQKLKNDFSSSNKLKIISLNPFNGNVKGKVEEYMKRNNYDFENYFVDRNWARSNKIGTYPTYLLLDKERKVLYTQVGYKSDNFESFRELIR